MPLAMIISSTLTRFTKIHHSYFDVHRMKKPGVDTGLIAINIFAVLILC